MGFHSQQIVVVLSKQICNKANEKLADRIKSSINFVEMPPIKFVGMIQKYIR